MGTRGARTSRSGRFRLRRWHIGGAGVIVTAIIVFTVLAVFASRSGFHPVLPAAFGQDGKCYYVRSPREATELKRAGDCPASAVPGRMPIGWLCQYYPFYASAYYVGTFVTPGTQPAFRSYLQSVDDDYAGQISDEAPDATYVTSDGDEVSGSAAGVTSSGTTMSSDGSSDGYGDAGDSAGDDSGDDGGGDDSGGDDGGDDGGGDGGD